MRTALLIPCLLALAACAPVQKPATAPGPPAEAALPRAIPGTDVVPIRDLLAPMPEALTSFGACSDGEFLYALGGYHGTPHVYSREGQHRGLSRLALDGSRGWEELSQLSEGAQGLALVHHAGKLCRVGGTEARNVAGTDADLHSSAQVACFDLAARSWTPLPPLPSGRSSHEAALIGSTLYVVGGWTLHGSAQSGTWQSDMLTLDLSVPGAQWQVLPAPFKRRALGGAAAAGKLVVVGGLTPEATPSTKVDVFDPATRVWSEGPAFPEDAFGIAVVGVGGAVVASARSGVVYRWQPGSSAWQPVTRLAFGRFFHRLVQGATNEVIALGGIGGMHDDGRTRHVERAALEAAGPRMVAWSMAYPGQAKNRQGAFVHGEHVLLFGGNNSLGQHDFEPENFVDQAWRLHLPSLQLVAQEPYPHKRQTMQTLSREDVGFSIGGFGHDGSKAVSHAEGYAFEFASGHWAPSIQLPESRTQFGLSQHGDALWVLGGLNFDPAREGEAALQHVTAVLQGRPRHDKSFVPANVELPGPRRAFASAVLGDELFIVGGMRGGFDLVEDCLRFNFNTRTFAPLACPQESRLSGTLLALDGRLYLAGGSVKSAQGMASAQDILELDPVSQRWRSVVQVPFETRHMHAMVYQERILLISTHNTDGKLFVALIDPHPAGK